MNDAIEAILKSYGKLDTPQDEINALKEVIQLITLLGMQRGGFFNKGCFYGGTALRILFGLDRFSEDLDFCLREADASFTLQSYFDAIQAELERFGFSSDITEKRTGEHVVIESAFVKQNTSQGLIIIGKPNDRLPKSQRVRVKIEVDKLNPKGFQTEEKLVKLPTPFMVSTLSEDSLFSGKLHALIARNYANRVKGRDYYDFLFYTARSTKVNMRYLEAKLRDSGHYEHKSAMTRDELVDMLISQFQRVDFDKAKEDVLPFIAQDKEADVRSWNAELFVALAKTLEIESH